MGKEPDVSDSGTLEQNTEPINDERAEALKYKNDIWVDSMWTTYQESLDFDLVNPADPDSRIRISRKISKGMSVKTGNKTPARIMNSALKLTLNPMMEEEKETWLNAQAMRKEIIETGKNLIKAISEMVTQFEDESTPEKAKSQEVEDAAKGAGVPAEENPSGDNGVVDNHDPERDEAF